MCIGRLKEANGISWRHRAPMVARVVLGDNISENTERTSCYATMITTHTFVYFQQSDASCVIGKIKGGNSEPGAVIISLRMFRRRYSASFLHGPCEYVGWALSIFSLYLSVQYVSRNDHHFFQIARAVHRAE